MQNRFVLGSALIAALATGATCSTARAGWYFRVVGNGAFKRSNPAYPTPAEQAWVSTDDDGWNGANGFPYPSGSYIGQTLELTSEGSLTLEAYFKPSANDPLPDSVTVKATTSSVGRKNPSAHGTSTFTTSASGYQGSRLFTFSRKEATLLPDGSYKFTRDLGSFKAQGKATIGTSPGQTQDADDPKSPDTSDYNISVSAAVYGSVSQDTRLVRIIRSSQDEFKSEHGDIETYGDTIYSYNEEHLEKRNKLVKTPQPNNVTFNAQFSGSWSHVLYPYSNPPSIPPGRPAVPKLDWQWSPSSDGDLQNSHSQEMPFGNFVYNSDVSQWMGKPTGRSEKVISYEASDLLDVDTGQPTQVKARATYHLTIHDPEEWNSTPIRTLPAVWDVFPATEVIKNNVGVGDSIEGKFQFRDFYFSLAKQAAKVTLAAGATISGEKVGFLFSQAVGLGLDTLAQDPSVQKGAQFEAAWQYYDEDARVDPNFTPDSSAICTWEGERPKSRDGSWNNTTVKMREYTFCDPELAVESISYIYEGTAWGKNGKVGDLQEGLSKATGTQYVIGNFKLGSPPTPPAPGAAPVKATPPQTALAPDASTKPPPSKNDEAPAANSPQLPSGGLS